MNLRLHRRVKLLVLESSLLEFRVLFTGCHVAAAIYHHRIIIVAVTIYHHHIFTANPNPYTPPPIRAITPIRVHLQHISATCPCSTRFISATSPSSTRFISATSPSPSPVIVALFSISRSRDTPSRDRVGLPNFRATRSLENSG